MKRKIFLYVLLALTVLFALCFSSCEVGDIHVDINGDISLDNDGDISIEAPDTESDTNKDTSTDSGAGDKTDTDTDSGGNDQGGDQGGTGNENPDQGGNDQGGDQGGTGNENPDQGGNDQGGDQGGTGNENPDQGGGDQGGDQGGTGNENPDQGGEGGNGEGNDPSGNEPPAPTTYTDENGFVYIEENGELYCVDFVRPVDGTKIVYMPSEYNGKSVVGIKTNSFTDFGVAFQQSEYKNASYYYTIAIPESIKVVEAAAFDLCWGIRICLYTEVLNGDKINYRLLDSSMKNDLPIILDWESKLILFDKSEKTNKQARDSIWGFRPALGWSRYSAVEIPDFYE